MTFPRGKEWRVERIALVAFIAGAALLTLLFALTPTTAEGRAQRLDRFLAVLPIEAATAFGRGDYAACAEAIDRLTRTDPLFHERYERLKDDELINHFSAAEVVAYFAEFFLPHVADGE